MATPDSTFGILTSILALLGGSAFVWKLVDLYRDRVRLGTTDITYEEHEDHGPVVRAELDNNGLHPLLLKREAVLYGIHLGVEEQGKRMKPRMKAAMHLLGERRLDPATSQRLQWKLTEEGPLRGNLHWLYWMRIRLQLTNRWRPVTIRIPRLGVATVGPIRFWFGYFAFRFFGRLTRAAKNLPPVD